MNLSRKFLLYITGILKKLGYYLLFYRDLVLRDFLRTMARGPWPFKIFLGPWPLGHGPPKFSWDHGPWAMVLQNFPGTMALGPWSKEKNWGPNGTRDQGPGTDQIFFCPVTEKIVVALICDCCNLFTWLLSRGLNSRFSLACSHSISNC